MEPRLAEVIDLFKSHKYNECLTTISQIEKEENLSPEIKKKVIDFKIKAMLMLRQYTDAHTFVDKAITTYENLEDWENLLEYIIHKINILSYEEKKEDALQIIDKYLEMIDKISPLTQELLEKKSNLLFWKGHLNVWTWDFNQAINYLQESIAFASMHSIDDIKHHSLHRLACVYGFIGEYDRAIEMIDQAVEYFVKKGDIAVAGIYHNRGILHAEKGEYKKTRENFEEKAKIVGQTPHDLAAIGDSYWREGEIEKGLEIMESGLKTLKDTFKNCENNVIVLFILANLNSRQGNQDLALEQYQKIIKIFATEPKQTLVGFSNVGIANIYCHKGELDAAIIFGNKALKFFGEYGIKYGMGWAHYILSKIFYEKNENEKAFHHLQICLDLRMAMGNKQDISHTLRDMIYYLIGEGRYDEVNDYFLQLEQLTSTTDNKIVNQNCRLSKALILKSKGRPKYWTQAIDIFEQIVSEPISEYNIILMALVNLCDILIDEFSISGDDEVLDDLETHTSRLLDIAQCQNSYTLRVEAYHIRIITLWLLAQHSKLEINIQNARRLLQEASELANSHGLVKLSSKITNQNEKMLEKIENWDEFIKKYYEFIKTN